MCYHFMFHYHCPGVHGHSWITCSQYTSQQVYRRNVVISLMAYTKVSTERVHLLCYSHTCLCTSQPPGNKGHSFSHFQYHRIPGNSFQVTYTKTGHATVTIAHTHRHPSLWQGCCRLHCQPVKPSTLYTLISIDLRNTTIHMDLITAHLRGWSLKVQFSNTWCICNFNVQPSISNIRYPQAPMLSQEPLIEWFHLGKCFLCHWGQVPGVLLK